MIEMLAGWLAPWQEFYADSVVLSTGVTAMHLVALLIAGGLAVSHDRAIWKGLPHAPVHRPVILFLVLLLTSGLLMAAADIEVYAASRVYWVKMALVATLLVNGLVLYRRHTRTTAAISVALWIATTIAGTVLGNV